jgi:hypothetical protein
LGNLKEKEHFEDLGVDERLTLDKLDCEKALTGLIGTRIRPRDELF